MCQERPALLYVKTNYEIVLRYRKKAMLNFMTPTHSSNYHGNTSFKK